MKKSIVVWISVTAGVLAALLLAAGGLYCFYTPSVTAEFSGDMTAMDGSASGYTLSAYDEGLAESELLESIRARALSVRVQDLESPAFSAAAEKFAAAGGKTIYVTVPDSVDVSAAVRESTEISAGKSYAAMLTYCLFSECDAGSQFGDFSRQDSREKFYRAWKQAYDSIKSASPGVQLAGPGFSSYNETYMKEFLTFCLSNECVPQTVTWRETDESGADLLTDHVRAYRTVEEALGMEALAVCINGYGAKSQVGNPAEMIKYVSAIELAGADGCVADWGISAPLCGTAGDSFTPNSNWWLYRWYADMQGKKAVLQERGRTDEFLQKTYKSKAGPSCIASYDETASEITALCGGANGKADIVFDGLDSTVFLLSPSAKVTVESVLFTGTSAAVSEPVREKAYGVQVKNGKLTVRLRNMEASAVYRITVTPAGTQAVEEYELAHKTVRYEAEAAKRNNNSDAAVVNTVYASSNGKAVSGTSTVRDSLTFSIRCPENGTYRLSVIYGSEDEKPDSQTDYTQFIMIDKGDVIDTSNYYNDTAAKAPRSTAIEVELEKGTHIVTVFRPEGIAAKTDGKTPLIDALDLTFVCGQMDELPKTTAAVLKDKLRSSPANSSFIAVAPQEGYYDLTFFTTVSYGENTVYEVAGTPCGELEMSTRGLVSGTVYLAKGINYMNVAHNESNSVNEITAVMREEQDKAFLTVPAADALLSGSVRLRDDGSVFSDETGSGSAAFHLNGVEKEGIYRVRVMYAPDKTVRDAFALQADVNGARRTLFFDNIVRPDALQTLTFTAYLKAGENTLLFSAEGQSRFPAIYKVDIFKKSL